MVIEAVRASVGAEVIWGREGGSPEDEAWSTSSIGWPSGGTVTLHRGL